MAWELAELLKDVVTGDYVPSFKYQEQLTKLKQTYYINSINKGDDDE